MNALARKSPLCVALHLLLLRPFLKIFFGVNIMGRENFDDLEQFMVISNHNSHLDILLLFASLPRKHIPRTRPVAAEEYFSRNRILYRLVGYLFDPIWIVREDKDADPLGEMRKALMGGQNVIIFPEGTRGEPGHIASFKTGIGRLSESFRNIPIIPVFLSGPEKAYPKSAWFPLPMWNEVIIGPPHVCAGDCYNITMGLEMTIRALASTLAAGRHTRPVSHKRDLSLAVLGIDGSGKSTLSRELAKSLSEKARVCLVTDDLELYEGGKRSEIQPLFTEKVREAVGKYAKEAKSLKHYKIPKLTELLLRNHLLGQVRRWYNPEVICQDGSPLLNLTAWSTLYKGDAVDAETCADAIRILAGRDDAPDRGDAIYSRFPELDAMKRAKLTSMWMPDAVIMLDVEPEISMDRIASRGERVQVHESREKLARLRDGYLMVCDVLQSVFGQPVMVIDGGQDFETVTASALDFIKRTEEERTDNGKKLH
jgi:1-acyl-sn-glycerol-3-phosphate acyltransferase